ncbi:MAG: caspase family protein [Cyanobacteria bacterium P01_D01_bin.50]
MAKLWAIAIGINQYQYLQALGYAQADAEGIRDFLVKQAGLPQEQCLLMTDSSVPIGDKPTLPTKNNILQLLEDLAANSWQPQDKLWLFFSGYGINHNGQDYLMPVEGDSKRISETAIEMRQLMQTLQVAELEVLLLLDFNRAFGTQADSLIGQETIELAQELQISAILSCQAEQFSHESSELGHGFFTAALLEALRYGNTKNLAGLESYLSIRTPELCQHHWRPVQNPITYIASPEQILLEPEEVKNDTTEPLDTLDSTETFTARPAPKLEEKQVDNSKEAQVAEVLSKSSSVSTDSETPQTQNTFIKPENKNSLGKSLLFGAGSTLVVCGLLLMVFLRHQSGLFQASDNNSGGKTFVKPLPSNLARVNKQKLNQPQANNSNLQETNSAMLELEKMSLKPNQASDLNKAIAIAKNIKKGEVNYKQAQKNIRIWSSMILDLAKDRAQKMEYASAIAAAKLVSQEESNYQEAQASIKKWRLESKQYLSNKTLLSAAQALIQPSQASTYNRAIEVARRIPQSQPGFAMAEKSINKWSREILRLAKTRADNKQFSSAVATAALAPEDTAAYAEAQQLIKQWQKVTTE